MFVRQRSSSASQKYFLKRQLLIRTRAKEVHQKKICDKKVSGTCKGLMGGVLMSGGAPIAEAAVRLRSLSS